MSCIYVLATDVVDLKLVIEIIFQANRMGPYLRSRKIHQKKQYQKEQRSHRVLGKKSEIRDAKPADATRKAH